MRNILNLFIRLSIVWLIFLSIGCASKDKEEDTRTPTELYTEASKQLKEKDYKKSADLFSQIVYRYPYYKWAAKAHMMEIYSYYLLKDYDSALATIDIFIRTHPASNDIAYIYYLRALTYYEQIDTPHRDQSVTSDAKKAFDELIARFPDSDYAKDGKAKLGLIDDHLAAQEMIIGRYYLDKGNILAGINRFKTVVEEYPTTSYVEEALYRLTEAYMLLGLKPEAQKYAAVLGHNYPKSKWYRESYNLLKK